MIKTSVSTDEWTFHAECWPEHMDAHTTEFDEHLFRFYWLAGKKMILCDRYGWIRVEDALPVNTYKPILMYAEGSVDVEQYHIMGFVSGTTHWQPIRGPIA